MLSSVVDCLKQAQPPLERLALIDETGSMTYGEFFAGVDTRARQLVASGIKPGDVVALNLPNGIEYAVTFHAIAATGAAVTPITAQLPARDRTHQLQLTGATHIIDALALQALDSVTPSTQPLPDVDSDAVACLPMSSGTTGRPKAVVLTHRQLSTNIEQFAAVAPMQPGDYVLTMLPLSHIYGLNTSMNVPLYVGCTLVLEPFNAERMFTLLQHYPIHTCYIAPPIATLMARRQATTYPNLRYLISGAAPLTQATAEAAEAHTGATMLQGYGMTEMAPVTHLRVRDSSPITSIGDPLPNTQHRLVDPETGTDVEPGNAGELWVSGPQMMDGYLNNEEGTDAVRVGPWLRTGDVARECADGSLEIIDRIKDVFKVRGFQVSPVKIEHVILEHPAITDCAVVRGFDAQGHAVVAVAAVTQPGLNNLAQVTTSALRRTLAGELADYELPRFVHVVPTIPRTSSGKIRRNELAATLGYSQSRNS